MSDWSYVTELFERALALGPADREALLQGEDVTHRPAADEVRAMLAAHDRAGDFLETPVWQARPDLLAADLGPSLTGLRIGPYTVGEEIGRGGMGVVYAAEDTRLGRLVALKVLSPAYSGDRTARERLAQEARAAATLSHPSIATVYALEDIDGHLFIVSELVRGSTLRRTLAAGALRRDVLLGTVKQIADALEAAHTRGIVHRDLKPENVLVGADGRIKVVDFGIARSLTPTPGREAALTITGAVLGTPGYMAPEQLRGAPIDARADVFAFGVMTYELATGAHPFGGSDPASVVERLVSDDPPLSRTIDPPDLDAIVRKCLQDPAGRFASGTELAAAIRAIEDAPRAPGPLLLAPSAWWWQFHQVAVAVITVLAVMHVGFNKAWLGSAGSIAFLTMLVLATISITLRLHLWFVSLVHPSMLRALRVRVLRWIAIVETGFAAACLGCVAGLAGPHDLMAAHLLVTALLLGLSLVVIEPATTRAALVV